MRYYKWELVPNIGIGWFTDIITSTNGRKFRFRSVLVICFRLTFIDKEYLK